MPTPPYDPHAIPPIRRGPRQNPYLTQAYMDRYDPKTPVYSGPDWIGVAITDEDWPHGPRWFGTRIDPRFTPTQLRHPLQTPPENA